jgi:Ca2+-binding RTX toxin-like protein
MANSTRGPILGRRVAAVSLLAGFSLIGIPALTAFEADSQPAEGAPGDPVIVAAGDIACPNTIAAYNGGEGTATQCRQKHTSEMILGADHVFVLGDGQYPTGSLSQYRAVYDPTWGRMKSVTHPTVGDHDYQSGSPAGYFSYWGVNPYYSFDIGSWHWVSLNSEIDHTAGSAQEVWLQQDLAATSQPCIGAFWGAPTFSSGLHGNNATFRPFWDDLYAAHADVVLAGDDHDYERFAKMAPDGTAAADGIREFVVGTGGRNLTGFSTIQPNSQARAKVFGVLEMTLGSADYSWRFRTESGGTFSDSGTAACNAKGSTPPTEPPPTEPPPTEPPPTPPPTTSSCYGVAATIEGTKGADTLTGTSGPDVITGLAGNDIVDGGDGNDLICTAGGTDQVNGGPGNDRVSGGAAADTLTDLSGADVLDGSTGNDTVDTADGAAGDTANGGGDVDGCSTDVGDARKNCEG